MLIRVSILSILVFIGFLYSCDAPRLNPLDPQNPDYIPPDTIAPPIEYSISGNIQTSSAPLQPIPNVEVIWQNENRFIMSDASGNFTFQNVEKKDGWLLFEKEGFFKDSAEVEWDTNKITVQKFLKALPSVTSFTINSEAINHHSRPTEFHLTFNTNIIDNDNIIDSVFVVNEELNINKLLIEIRNNIFQNDFEDFQLGLNTIHDVIGKDFDLRIKDTETNILIAESSNVERIITQEVEFKSPFNNDSVSSTPTLEWFRFRPGWSFHYLVQVFTNETGATLIYERDNIPPDSISLTVSEPIINNGLDEYFWVIWCVDEFNNKSRSKPASFIVK